MYTPINAIQCIKLCSHINICRCSIRNAKKIKNAYKKAKIKKIIHIKLLIFIIYVIWWEQRNEHDKQKEEYF